MKKLLLITTLLGALVFAGCGAKTPTVTTPQTTGAVIKTFDTTGFSIQYPAARTVQENIYGAQVMFFSPQLSGDQFRENVGIVSETLPSDISVADYYTTIKSQIVNLVQNYQELLNEDITLNGITAKKIVYAGTQSDYQLKWEQVIVIKNKVAYILNYTASAGTFDEFTKEVDAIVNSFMLK